MISAENKKTSC